METTIKTTLQEIKGIFNIIAPNELKNRFIKKAEEKAIADFESLIGEQLPNDFRQFLLNNDFKILLEGNYDCLTLEGVQSYWESYKEEVNEGIYDGRVERVIDAGFTNWDSKKIKQVWWSSKWVPFAVDSCGNMKCIDLDPGELGSKYQILSIERQDGQGPYVSQYTSFLNFLEKYLSCLKNKQYRVTEDGIIEMDSDIKPSK